MPPSRVSGDVEVACTQMCRTYKRNDENWKQEFWACHETLIMKREVPHSFVTLCMRQSNQTHTHTRPLSLILFLHSLYHGQDLIVMIMSARLGYSKLKALSFLKAEA